MVVCGVCTARGERDLGCLLHSAHSHCVLCSALDRVTYAYMHAPSTTQRRVVTRHMHILRMLQKD